MRKNIRDENQCHERYGFCPISGRISSPTNRPGKSAIGRSSPEELMGS